MKHILKVANISETESISTRPLIAMDNEGNLFCKGVILAPEGFVDFGLPSGTFWYSMNLGATNGSTPESWYGNYYAWGETSQHEGWPNDKSSHPYNWNEYKYANDSYDTLTKYCNDSTYGNEGFTDDLTELVASDDAAKTFNTSWKMPTKEDFEELIAKTANEWVTDYNGIQGLNGRLFKKATITRPAFKNTDLYTMFDASLQPVENPTIISNEMWATMSMYSEDELNALVSQIFGGQITDITTIIFTDQAGTLAEYGTDYGFVEKEIDSSVSMFIPAAGYCYGSNLRGVGGGGGYWSSSLYAGSPYDAWSLYFNDVGVGMYDYSRCSGFSVRPVSQ